MKRLRRSTGGWFAGSLKACALAFGWNPWRLRLAYGVATVLTGVLPGVILYLLAWLVVPVESEFSGRRFDLRDI